MKIGIYNPYLDSLGGGEYYSLMIAVHWAKTHEVEIFWDEPTLHEEIKTRFNIDIESIKFTANIFRHKHLLQKLFLTKQYDLIFFLSDGSIPTSLARYNILHFQVPFHQILFSRLKLSRFQAIVCNSQFTRDKLDRRLWEKSTVIYPPVRLIERLKIKKQPLILSVGRFSGHFQAKKQEILIEAFHRAQITNKLKGWQLILTGGLMETDRAYFDELLKRSTKLSIKLMPNISYNDLTKLYNQATLYWHAAGFGETKPERMEHFGISTVEAMSAGCIPLAFAGGGQSEIIETGISGFLWQTIDELIEKSEQLTKKSNLRQKLALAAEKRTTIYSPKRFFTAFDKLLDKITT